MRKDLVSVIKNVYLSIDVEAFSDLAYANGCYNDAIILNSGVEKFLELLDDNGWPGIAFLLADKLEMLSPILLKELGERCQLGLHGFHHRLPMSMDIKSFRESVQAGRNLVEDMTGLPCHAYRAPCFSIDSARLKVLSELGFKFDSSVMRGVKHPLYGNVDLTDFTQSTDPNIYWCKDLKIFTMNYTRILGANIPYSGGGWFRLLGRNCVSILDRCSDFSYINIYSHPFEFSDVDPLSGVISVMKRFRSIVGRESFRKELERFIKDGVANREFRVSAFE